MCVDSMLIGERTVEEETPEVRKQGHKILITQRPTFDDLSSDLVDLCRVFLYGLSECTVSLLREFLGVDHGLSSLHPATTIYLVSLFLEMKHSNCDLLTFLVNTIYFTKKAINTQS